MVPRFAQLYISEFLTARSRKFHWKNMEKCAITCYSYEYGEKGDFIGRALPTTLVELE